MSAPRERGRPSLLFDLDGTLSDNYPGISRSIVYALDRMGIEPPSPEVLRRCVGPPMRETFAWLLDTGDAAIVEQAIAFYRERYGDVGWRENVVYDGVIDALAQLAQSAPLYLCTSKPEVYARRIVNLFGLSEYLRGVYGAALDGSLDDKATLLAHAAREEGFACEDAILTGDRMHDIRAARRNGARCVGVLWGYGTREELAPADVLAERPADLPAIIAALIASPTSR
jgi:phosphoglycolate phosphatase